MRRKKQESVFVFRENSPCPYFDDGRIAAVEFLFPDAEDIENFHEFLSRGYRRLGSFLYRNVCKGCSCCRPIRLEIEHFQLSKSQKRTYKKNDDIRVEIYSSASITRKKMALYKQYVNSKHGDVDKEGLRHYESALSRIHRGYTRVIEMDYYLEEKLIGVGIVDEGSDSLSSNYFYYDTGYLGRRPGVFSVLKEISLARQMGKKYYYLGFYIEEALKMSYKKYFRPNQLYQNGEWKEFL